MNSKHSHFKTEIYFVTCCKAFKKKSGIAELSCFVRVGWSKMNFNFSSILSGFGLYDYL